MQLVVGETGDGGNKGIVVTASLSPNKGERKSQVINFMYIPVCIKPSENKVRVSCPVWVITAVKKSLMHKDKQTNSKTQRKELIATSRPTKNCTAGKLTYICDHCDSDPSD